MTRPTRSTLPPGGKGTIQRIGRCGKSADHEPLESIDAATRAALTHQSVPEGATNGSTKDERRIVYNLAARESGGRHMSAPEEEMTPEAVIARAIARRGEIFDEFRLLATESPRTYDLISRTAGYMHHYQGAEGAKQQLSGTMRELI